MAQATSLTIEGAGRRDLLIAGMMIVALGLLAMVVAPKQVQAGSHEPPGGPKWQFHVAPWGDDSWNGTPGRPFATLQRAQQSVRANTAGMKRDIVVNLHPGTHNLSAPLRLRSHAGDSGENGNRVIYQAYRYGTKKQAPVVLSGGRQITGWEFEDADQNIWRAHVGDLETRQLYVDGKRAKQSEFGAPIPGNLTLTADGYVTDSTVPQSWHDPEDIEIAMRWSWYNEPRCGVADISGDAHSTTITMDQPCFGWAKDLFSGQFIDYPPIDLTLLPPHPENSKSFLTEPGTFYLDRTNPGHHVLNYIPRAGENLNSSRVVAPVLEQIVRGRGTPANPLHDVTFRGLEFADATWLEPGTETGFVQVFSGIYEHGDPPLDDDPFNISGDARTTPGNVSFHGAKRVVFEDNRFARLGAAALEFALGSSDNLVKGNVFTDVSAGGIELGNRYPDTTVDEENADNVIANNWVHNVGAEFPGSPGIYLEMTQGTKVANNQVNDTAYSGVVTAQYWVLGANNNLSRGARIVNNKVFDTLTKMADGGGIYIATGQGTSYDDGAVMEGNLTYDNVGVPLFGGPRGGIGLYTDDESDYVKVTNNVTYNNGFNAFGGCLPVGHIRITQNYWDNDVPGWACGDPADTIVVTDNTLLSVENPTADCQAIPDCAEILANAGLRPEYQHLLDD